MSRSLPPSPVVPAERRVAGVWTPGRVCTLCIAWAARHVALRHVAGCRAGDCQ